MIHVIKVFFLFTLILGALALSGCESESPLIPATPERSMDTAPPAIVTGLSAVGTEALVKVSWDANVLDEDFHGFMVYRVVWGSPFPMLDLPQQNNQWIDDHPVNVACTYVVTALDHAGNESAWAAVNFLGVDEGRRMQRES